MSTATVEVEETKSKSIDVPALLRQVGAAAVLVSFVAFMFKGWTDTNDLVKFAMLLGSTVSIAGVALFIAQLFREGKGPRLLMSLALVAVPVNFTILGAFIFFASAKSVGIEYPEYLAWTIDSWSATLFATGAGIVLLLPVIWLGFRTLARSISVKLTGFFILSNLLLLVPLRDAMFVSIVGIVLGAIAIIISSRTMRSELSAKTFEGKLALMIQFIPLGIILGRNLWLYASHDIVLLVVAAVFFVALRQIALLCEANSNSRNLINIASLLPSIAIIDRTQDVFTLLGASSSIATYLATVIGAALVYEISQRAALASKGYRVLAMAILFCGTMITLFMYSSSFTSCAVLGTGIGLIMASFYAQQRGLCIAGIAMTLTAFVDLTIQAFSVFHLGSWFMLLLTGIVAIVAASAIDTYGARLRQSLQAQRSELGTWEF